MRTSLILTLLTLLASCRAQPIDSRLTVIYKQAEIDINVFTRGGYNYLIKAQPGQWSSTYLINNFPDSLKQYVLTRRSNQLIAKLLVSGTISPDSVVLMIPGADDIPIPSTRKVPTITLTSARPAL